jgi:hypothetical protein
MNNRWIIAVATFAAAILVFSAAALAQTPSPGATETPGETTTATATLEITGTVTSTVTSTVVATNTAVVTGTVVVTATQPPIPTIPVPTAIYVPGGTGGFPFADPAFKNVWTRTDQPVASGQVSRTWFWGPGPNTPGLIEEYDQGVGGKRLVQYFDKSRMEINNPAGDRSQPFFVTNGLLTVELISGFIQLGDANFTKYHPACIPMSGDFGDTLAPTYFAFQGVSNTQAGDHPSPDRTGQKVTETIDRDGHTGTDPSKASVPGVNLVHFDTTTHHNIPAIFWDFLNSSGPVLNPQGQIVNEQLIQPWNFASGLPISEPYWAKARIAGEVKDVMIQAYERRVLTYVPTNPTGFQVEMGNIGQHYFDWRYRNYGYCTSVPVITPTPPVVATGTVVSGTPQPTTTAVGTGTTTPEATGTVVSGTTTPEETATATLFVATATPTMTVGPIETP